MSAVLGLTCLLSKVCLIESRDCTLLACPKTCHSFGEYRLPWNSIHGIVLFASIAHEMVNMLNKRWTTKVRQPFRICAEPT